MFYIVSNLLILLFVISVFYFLWQGAIFVPSSDRAVATMVKLSGAGRGDKIADLGSGDGKLLIAFAKKGIEVHGFEINPVLYTIAKMKIRKAGFAKVAFVHFRSFWKADLSEYKIVTVFGISHIMGRIERKLYEELKPGAKILSNLFPLPTKKFEKKENGVYLYKV